ncbi:hypothetical protein PHMEG_00028089 [Phytophthora megakarya]|uniref:Uncharacterized protein n=1 Tax=Phytophthora megakarya TaxID=4795 RepID=A0A225V5D8_9STRA|nr:hypothetical protein PHMEG_00028089 [Phytophthora megakarya]
MNAIVDLYNEQVVLRRNSNQRPQTPAVKQLIKNAQTETTATKKKNYEGRGIGSVLDGYSSAAQFQQICNTFCSLDDIRGRTAFLLSQYGLLCGDKIRDLEFADMFSQKLDGEGYPSCIALRDKSITYETHKASSAAVFKYLGLTFNKKSNINRFVSKLGTLISLFS